MDKFGKALTAGKTLPSTGLHVAGCRDSGEAIKKDEGRGWEIEFLRASVICIVGGTFHALSFNSHNSPTRKILLF